MALGPGRVGSLRLVRWCHSERHRLLGRVRHVIDAFALPADRPHDVFEHAKELGAAELKSPVVSGDHPEALMGQKRISHRVGTTGG